ncbi:conserved hypothetical protein [uncultured Thiomicrorhabdus sp.]
MKSGKDYFEEGTVELRKGKHIGPNRGFGAEHIWAEHHVELKKMGFEAKEDVPKFVAKVISTGAPIYCEFSHPGGNHRVTVVKNKDGHIAILERKNTEYNNTIYSVVTAFTKGKAHGTRIGTVG